VTLGYEPQYLLLKKSSGAGDWFVFDTMRGWSVTANPYLVANTSAAESPGSSVLSPTATGFQITTWDPSTTYIYIAIRRPMKPPSAGTEVYTAVSGTGGSSTTPCFVTNWPVDFAMVKNRAFNAYWADASRLQGEVYLQSSSTVAETTSSNYKWDYSTGWSKDPTNSTDFFSWNFKRASGFFDVVCYTGDGGINRAISHNLTVAPELIIVKGRSIGGYDWPVYADPLGNTKYLTLNTTAATVTDNVWNNTSPTTTTFTVRNQYLVNNSGDTYVAYLFATVAGVSKVGSYTGTGTTLQVNCGFSSGARFVLIKRTDSTGDWYVWDSARGIVSGNDPYLLLNSTAAEVTNTDYVDTYSAGFEISSTAPAAINANGGSFIYLAIA
jgi:hypothetical protein